MGKITEQQQWDEDIYLIEKQDKVLGGELGVINIQAKQLANRTKYLKDQVITINQDRTGYAPKTSPAFTGIPTAPTAAAGTNNTQIATTAFVKTAIAATSAAVRHKQLTELLPNSSTQRWQSALPNELPFGTVMGFSQRSILNTNDETYSGWGMVSRTHPTDAAMSVRFGINFGKFYVQQAKSETVWGKATEVVMARTLTAESLNDVTNLGVYCQTDIAQSTATLNYPETQGGTLWVSPATDGVLQEYTVNNGHRYIRSNPRGAWGAWQRIDVLDLTDALIGVPIPHPLSTVPAGCLAMNGQRFDTRRYPKLAQKYPSGQLPDLRGEFIRGWDNGRGVDSGRGLLSVQGDAIRNITGEVNTDNGWFFNTLIGAFYDSREAYTNQQRQRTRAQVIPAIDVPGLKKGYFGLDASRVVPTANENRPRNIAFHYICLAA